jgi:hypothetical protein
MHQTFDAPAISMHWPYGLPAMQCTGHLMHWAFNALSIQCTGHSMHWPFNALAIQCTGHSMHPPFDAVAIRALAIHAPAIQNIHGYNWLNFFQASLSDRCGALHVGDLLLAVNGVNVAHLNLDGITELIRGDPSVSEYPYRAHNH